MATYYFIVAFVLVLGFYAFANLKLRKDFVMGVVPRISIPLPNSEKVTASINWM